ncbi:hypothetical protein ACE09S_004574 [Salmonella enterica]
MKMGRRIKLAVFVKNKFTTAIVAIINADAVTTFVLIQLHTDVAVFIHNSEMHTPVIFQKEVAGHGVAGFLDGV